MIFDFEFLLGDLVSIVYVDEEGSEKKTHGWIIGIMNDNGDIYYTVKCHREHLARIDKELVDEGNNDEWQYAQFHADELEPAEDGYLRLVS